MRCRDSNVRSVIRGDCRTIPSASRRMVSSSDAGHAQGGEREDAGKEAGVHGWMHMQTTEE